MVSLKDLDCIAKYIAAIICAMQNNILTESHCEPLQPPYATAERPKMIGGVLRPRARVVKMQKGLEQTFFIVSHAGLHTEEQIVHGSLQS